MLLSSSARERLITDVCSGERMARHTGALVASILLFGGLYGAVLGLWHSPKLAFYDAVKFPLLLLSTAVLTSLFNWVAASIVGVPLKYGQVALMSVFALAISAIILGSVAPIAWFMTTSLPPPSATASGRTAHNTLYLLHTLLVGAAGLAGTTFLFRVLVISADTRRARVVFAIWIISFALTGGEVGWLLRPFVGSVYYPVVFIRADSFERNVYEFIASDIVPHLLRQLRGTS